jgi:hypothetical protein
MPVNVYFGDLSRMLGQQRRALKSNVLVVGVFENCWWKPLTQPRIAGLRSVIAMATSGRQHTNRLQMGQPQPRPLCQNILDLDKLRYITQTFSSFPTTPLLKNISIPQFPFALVLHSNEHALRSPVNKHKSHASPQVRVAKL